MIRLSNSDVARAATFARKFKQAMPDGLRAATVAISLEHSLEHCDAAVCVFTIAHAGCLTSPNVFWLLGSRIKKQ